MVLDDVVRRLMVLMLSSRVRTSLKTDDVKCGGCDGRYDSCGRR